MSFATSYEALKDHKRLEFVRFSLGQRLEHLLLIFSFTALTVTGIPQMFHTAGWADWAINAMGGIETLRQIHHFFAVVFILEGIYHTGYVAYLLFVRRGRASMLPGLADAREAIHTVFYLVGLAKTMPRCDRFDFRQKFEYWGVVWGGIVMIGTGLLMWFPVQVTHYLPGEIVPAAKAAHGGEALLAMLVIVTWHFYGAHLSPHALPFDTTIFTGKISSRRMAEEHPREYERLTGRSAEAELEEEHHPVRAR